MNPARVVGLDQNDGPVEAGEQRVIDVLRDGLDERFTIAPNLQMVHRGGQVDDVDVLVVGPYGIVAIEVKNLGGEVIVSEREMFVDGHGRRNPYVQTYAKARRIKGRIADHPQTEHVWVSPLVVLAQEPRVLRVPDNQRDDFVLVDDVVEALLDEDRWRGRGLSSMERDAALRQFELVSRPRPQIFNLGPYRIGQLISETNTERRYTASHTVMGTEHEIVHIGYDPRLLGSDGGRSAITAAYREALALKDVGVHPNVRAATDLFTEEDGSAVLVLPASTGRSLRDMIDEGEDIDTETAASILLDVVAAVAHVHAGGVAHRRVCPTLIEVDPDGVAVLSGFGFAQVPGQEGGTQHLSIGLSEVEIPFIAPELFLTGTAGLDADLFGIGTLAAELGIETLGGFDLAGLRATNPDDREPSVDELFASASAQPETPDEPAIDGYQILKTLSESASRETFLGYNVLSGEQVVMRSFAGALAVDDARTIYQAMAASRHSGLESVNTMQRGADESVVVISQCVDGMSLAEAIDTATLPEDKLAIVLELARAVETLHDSGWVHGDITPANVILGDDGPVLIDFGIAAKIPAMPAGGTPAYRPAPGWIRSETPIDLDLFGLGIVAHELLYGSRPAITDDGLEVEADEPWSAAVSAALGLEGAPECHSVEEFIDVLSEGNSDQEGEEEGSEDTSEADLEESGEREGGLYRRVDELIIAGRLDEAEQLCPPEWMNLRERIVRSRRQQADQADEEQDAWLHIGRVAVHTGPVSREQIPSTISGEKNVRAQVTQFSARVDDMVSELRVIEADNGESWITCVDVSGSDELYNAIVNRLRIGARAVGAGEATVDLAMAVQSDDRWSARSVTRSEIVDVTGLQIADVLSPIDGVRIGKRSEVLDDRSPRSGYLAAVFDEKDTAEALVRSFTLLRINPILAAPSGKTEQETVIDVGSFADPYPSDISPRSVVGFESSRAEISERLVKIVGHEGPMNFKRFARSFRVAAGAGRVTGTRRALLWRSIETAVLEGDIELLGRPSDDEAVLKTGAQPSVHVREMGNRSLDEIPLNELGEVIIHYTTLHPDLQDESLHTQMLRDFYGRERIHDSALRRLDRARSVATDTPVDTQGPKYGPLERHLTGIHGRRVSMDFDEINNLVGGLPPSAYEHQAWWSNSPSHVQASAWLNAGWRVVAVSFFAQRVRFSR